MMLQIGLGIDFGSEFHKSAMVIPGKYFTMVENRISKKKTPTSIAFCDGDRLFENQAIKKRFKKKCDSFSFTPRFLWNKQENTNNFFLDSSRIKRDEFGYLVEVRKQNLPRSLNFTRVNEDGTGYWVRGEELNAMIIENNLRNAKKTGEKEFKEGVITIPSNDLSIEERKRIKAMNDLAGFKTLALIHENTAAAVYQRMDMEIKQKDYNVLVVNIGSSGTKISLMNYGNDKVDMKGGTGVFPSVNVIDDIYTDKVSGYSLDRCLSDYALDTHISGQKNKEELRSKIDLYKTRRIVNDIKKAKEVLGVNKQYKIRLEDFFDYMPLTATLMRKEFEEKCDSVFDELKTTLKDFKYKLRQRKYFTKNITAIELIGGGVRVPKVHEILREFYDMKPSTRINGDEGSALGTAFLAANYSSGVRTKKIVFNDGPNYKVDVSIRFDNKTGWYKDAEVFPYKTTIGTQKSFSIPNLMDSVYIKFIADDTGGYEKEYLVSGIDKALETVHSQNVTEWKVLFSLEMDLLGIPNLLEANLMYKEKPKKDTNSTKTNSKPKVNKKRLDIEITSENKLSILDNREQLIISKKFMRGMNKYEEEKEEMSKLRNELESFAYNLKHILKEESKHRYLSEAEKKVFREKSQQVDEYLESNELHGADLFQLKTKQLENKKFIESFDHRHHSHMNRDKLLSKTMQLLDKSVQTIHKLKRTRAWIPDSKITISLDSIKEIRKSIKNSYSDQIARPLFIDPVFTKDFVAGKLKTVDEFVRKLQRIERPKKTEKKEDKKSVKERVEDVVDDISNTDLRGDMTYIEDAESEKKRLSKTESGNEAEGEETEEGDAESDI